MTNDEQYVPSEDEMRRAYWLTRMLDHHAAVDAAFDRFLARVRRDAAREALDGLAAAEHRATRAEAQSDARRINAEYWKTLAGEHRARFQAVEDVLAAWHVEPGESGLADDLLRALNT